MEHCDNNTNQNTNGQSPDSISQCSRPGLAVLLKGGNMKTLADAENALRNELKTWFLRQSRDPLADYYLYYMAATPEHNGGLIICRSDLTPENPDYYPAMISPISKASSIDENTDYLKRHILGTLPILS